MLLSWEVSVLDHYLFDSFTSLKDVVSFIDHESAFTKARIRDILGGSFFGWNCKE